MTTPAGPGGGAPDPGLAVIMNERRRLINLAYRLLGSLADAEDAVQEAYARWYAMSRQQQESIESPGGATADPADRVTLDESQRTWSPERGQQHSPSESG